MVSTFVSFSNNLFCIFSGIISLGDIIFGNMYNSGKPYLSEEVFDSIFTNSLLISNPNNFLATDLITYPSLGHFGPKLGPNWPT